MTYNEHRAARAAIKARYADVARRQAQQLEHVLTQHARHAQQQADAARADLAATNATYAAQQIARADAMRVELAELDASYAAQQRERAAPNAAYAAQQTAEQTAIRKILDATPLGGKSKPLHFFNVAIEEALADYPGWELDPDDKCVTRPK